MAQGRRIAAERGGDGGDVHEAAAGFEEGEEGLAGFEGAVVVALESLLHDITVCTMATRMLVLAGLLCGCFEERGKEKKGCKRTEPVQGYPSVINQHVDSVWVLLLEEVAELLDTLRLADI